MKTITLKVDGMMCNNCRTHVEKALNELAGVSAAVDLENKQAVCTVEGNVDTNALVNAVQHAGYTVFGAPVVEE